MIALLKKNAWGWNSEADLAFQSLKQAMTQAPLLALLNFSLSFILECDASGTVIGAVLMQMECPIAYLSHTLHGRNLDLSTYEKEYLAIIIAVQKWRHYLLGRRFMIWTDQQSLKFILEQWIATPTQQLWISKLMGLITPWRTSGGKKMGQPTHSHEYKIVKLPPSQLRSRHGLLNLRRKIL